MTAGMQSNHMNPLTGAQFQIHANILHYEVSRRLAARNEIQDSQHTKKKKDLKQKDPRDLPLLAWVCYLIQGRLNTTSMKKIVRKKDT